MTPPPASASSIRQTTPGLQRWELVLLTGLCLATLLYGAGNLSLQPARVDGKHNLIMGIQLVQESARVNYWREPFVPIVIAAIIRAQRALGYEPVSFDCADRSTGQTETLQCRRAYAPYKIMNAVFVLVAGVGVFFLCRWYIGVSWLSYVAFFLVTQSLLFPTSDRFLTEIPAAALMVLVSCLGVLALARRHVCYSALLGLALAALVLTKIVFLYFWPFVVAVLVASDLWQKTLGRRTVLRVGVFLFAHFLPIGGWMARNYIVFDDFSVVRKGRSKLVFAHRAAYNTMRDDELVAGFWYYTPYKPDLGIPKRSYERFEGKNANGFRQMGYRMGHNAPTNEAMRARLLADPWQHLKVSTLLAWRGLFVQKRLGHGNLPHFTVFGRHPLPREWKPALVAETIARRDHRRGKEAYVVWFQGRGTVDGYGEAELKRFLNLETVAELADATLYRVPPPDDFVARFPSMSEFMGADGAAAAKWLRPSEMYHYFREAPFLSTVWSNHVPSLPRFRVAAPRLADVWGLDSWPRWGWRFDPVTQTLVNLVGGLALLVVPLWFGFRGQRRLEVLFIVLPALYMHAVYAVVSHFITRYAYPGIPLRVWATLLLVCLVASWVRRQIVQTRPYSRPAKALP